ncbi:MAG: hypothetical protein CM15mV4_0720 [Caudoviricetes sp.]|nr:MAG: hypothetical protein CM15mV4_0720 [Caudoviricetes sp.]
MRINKQTDYIRFQFFEYEPPFKTNTGGGLFDAKKTKITIHQNQTTKEI